MPEPATNAVRAYVEEHVEDLHADLDAWLRIPSISSEPANAADVRRSAQWAVERFARAGFTAELWETGGHPAVYAERLVGEDCPTVVVYGHHDVQPVDPLELWNTPPFEPTIRGEELFARGAIDDKGQVLFHLLGLDAALAAYGEIGVNLKFLVEGEEESGSPNFPALLRRERERLRCDVVVVSDTGVWDRDTPAVCTAMRGVIGCDVNFFGPDGDVHSGGFGGAIPNPATELARLVARLHDAELRVTIPGFYDRVEQVSARERAMFAALPFDEKQFLGEAESHALTGEAGFTTLERIWSRPTAEVNGLSSGYSGPGSKTIIPARANAKLTFRLVHDQQPAEIAAAVDRWVEGNTPVGIRSEVRWESGGVRPCLTSLDHPALQACMTAMERAFDKPCLPMREGGSGPEADLAEILEAPLVFLGVGLPDDRIHAPNERVILPMLYKGAEAAAYLWDELPRALRH